MFLFGIPALIVNVLVLAVVIVTSGSDRADNSLQAQVPKSVSSTLVQPEILISVTDEIPTKRIVEFKNLVMVSRSWSQVLPGDPLPGRVMSQFTQEVQNVGANAVINFRIEVVTHPSPLRTFILFGNAVVVE